MTKSCVDYTLELQFAQRLSTLLELIKPFVSNIICLGRRLCLLSIDLISCQTCSFLQRTPAAHAPLGFTHESQQVCGTKQACLINAASVAAEEFEKETGPESFALALVMSLSCCVKNHHCKISASDSLISATTNTP